MLQLMGYEVADDTENELQTATLPADDAFVVDVNIRQMDNKLMVASAVQLASVDIVSYSGATLATLELGGAQTTEIDLNPYDGEDRLVLNIRSLDGKVVNKQVDR